MIALDRKMTHQSTARVSNKHFPNEDDINRHHSGDHVEALHVTKCQRVMVMLTLSKNEKANAVNNLYSATFSKS